MTDETLGIIQIIKGWGYPNLNMDERIAQFLRDYRGTNFRFDRECITKELRNAAVDYFSTCDDPVKEIRRYFLDRAWMLKDETEYNVLLRFLGGIKVRENGEYINGFREYIIDEKEN